ncbi:MAG: V-type ATP synthase subunit D, partial [Peptoniphilaceae bacterium]|nr:V-type ATP synthase subunit D [Peptoniphilaceae bacterium]
MARLNVTPTRINLTTLKGKLERSKRGYKLLKDKQDELMRQFIELIRKNQSLRKEVEEELSLSFKDFLVASALMSPKFLSEAVSFPTQKVGVEITTENIMSVNVPKMKFEIEKNNEKASMFPYGYAKT